MAPSRTVKSKSRPRRDPSSHGVLRPHKSPKGSYLYVKNLDAPGASSSKLERHSNDLDVELPVDAEAVVDKGELLTDDSILRLQKDPLSVLDDLSFDLVLQCFDVKDLLTACAVSRLWRRRMDTWILNSTSRLQKLVLGVPVGLDPKMKPEEFLTSWRRKGIDRSSPHQELEPAV